MRCRRSASYAWNRSTGHPASCTRRKIRVWCEDRRPTRFRALHRRCFDCDALAESFFATLQAELLDRRRWNTRQELALAVFDYIERFYNPTRRHSRLGYRSPVEFETLNAAAPAAA